MKKDTSKTTMLVISTGFLILYLALRWKGAAVVSLTAGAAGIVSSSLSRKIERAWMKLAKFLGDITSNVLLSAIFYLILFPIAAFSRLFNKDPLMLSKEYKTYFIDINRKIDKRSFEKIW